MFIILWFSYKYEYHVLEKCIYLYITAADLNVVSLILSWMLLNFDTAANRLIKVFTIYILDKGTYIHVGGTSVNIGTRPYIVH